MPRVRRDAHGLGPGWNDTLLWYARGVRALQTRPITEPTSWQFLAAIHGFHPQVWQQFGLITASTALPSAAVQRRFWSQCQHQTWYFLPWHRGYLSAFEDIVRDAIVAAGGPADWALPYWNYSDATRQRARRLPDAFEAPALPDGSPNPLRVTRRYGSGRTPIELDPTFVALDALQHDAFEGGEDDVPPGFGGPPTLFHHGPESETTNGGLESLPHNVVHSAIGGVAPRTSPRDWRNFGLMSIPQTAALDPIFWLHHANIDRLWKVWLRDRQEPHTDPQDAAWLDGPVARPFVLPRATDPAWTFTARDVADTTTPLLDYVYEDEAPAGAQTRLARRLDQVSPRVAAATRRREVPMPTPRRSPQLIGASDGPVQVTGAGAASVSLDGAAARTLGTAVARMAAADTAPEVEPARTFLKLENVRSTSDAAIYHVYVAVPEGVDPATHPERRAGTVSLFGVSAASDPDGPTAGSGINQVLEITHIVDALHLAGAPVEHLDVRFVPATEAVADAAFTIGRISVFTLGG